MLDYKFKSIVFQTDLNGLGGSGIIGLAPSAQDYGAQLFVPSLYKQGAIKKNMFSMFIDHLNGVSKIQMGGYDTKKYASGPLNWYSITDPMYWQFDFSNAKMGDFELNPSTTKMMADTGTSLNMIPEEDFQKIYTHFLKDKLRCHTLKNTLLACDCTKAEQEAMPDITFNIGAEEYVIPRNQWFERSGNQCIVKFMHAPHRNFWILGLNFFNNYYTVFDYENLKIGFAKSKNFGTQTSSSFISWATGKAKKTKEQIMNEDYLMNLIRQNSNDSSMDYILGGTVVGALVGAIWYQSKKEPVKASVEPEYQHNNSYAAQL